MGHGKGQIKKQKIVQVLKQNGYRYVRSNGHDIYKNDSGVIISVPRSCNKLVMQREFKTKGIAWTI